MESSKETHLNSSELASQEMLNILKRYVDVPISLDDLQELNPEIDWYNKVDGAWADLRGMPEISDRLRIIERYREPAYVLVSNTEDSTILYKRSYKYFNEKITDTSEKSRTDLKKYAIAIALGAGALTGIILAANKYINKK